MNENLSKSTQSSPYYQVLDGWRGISILCVLSAHLLPLGAKSWQLNSMAGILGMSLFFILSGFLIASSLIQNPSIKNFLIRRSCRILPLAWTYLLIVLPIATLITNPFSSYMAHFLFYANLPPFWLTNITSHFWSLCVEIHFYLAIALIVFTLGQRGLLLLPAICFLVTIGRIWQGATVSIITYYRVDEILAGACLALVYQGWLGKLLPKFLSGINSYIIIGLLIISCHPNSGPVNYIRPYLAALLVGSTLYQDKTQLSGYLKTNILGYIAKVSYALYIIHPLTHFGWLESGGVFIKYAVKRPISLLLSFGLAHISTFYYEKRWIAWGKTLMSKPS